eukprot:CAMPEP_0197517718 /NCGR_PEP_ID=MMETSP1318-20131121/2783_1 /TAXON_ID=552666 /ORGANISM="Partenskyella glossopodia, Strain RCC365" /LENGTH=92 /DNA_ID=CAMNT_0043067517 /DNA_START=176 /DNA_END=454 /DNA_ORIENTATION=+
MCVGVLSCRVLQKLFTLAEVKKHNKEGDCWMIINNGVYDVSKFAKFHPGGKKIILKEGGKDASKKFKMFHGPHVLKKYDKRLKIGTIAKAKL